MDQSNKITPLPITETRFWKHNYNKSYSENDESNWNDESGLINDDDDQLTWPSCFCFQLELPSTIVWMFCGMKHWCAISVLFAFIIVKFLWWAVITRDQIFAIILLPTKYNVSINYSFHENAKTYNFLRKELPTS